MQHTHIPIQPMPAEHADGCSGCEPGNPPAHCHAGLGEPCATPRLTGRSELLGRAMDSLRRVMDPGRGLSLVDLQLVQALHVDYDEAALTVTFPQGCGSARLLAEEAFQSLRNALPDTDIYVLHAA